MKKLALYCLLAFFVVGLAGCGKDVDLNQAVEEVKAAAAEMDLSQLKAKVQAYQKALEAKKAEVEALAQKLKDIPLKDKLGEEAKKLKGKMDEIASSVKTLKSHYGAYLDALKAKGGSL